MVVLVDLFATAAVSAVVTIGLMFVFYRFWILPYLTEISLSIPASVKELVFPYVDELKGSILSEIETKIEEVSKSVKTTSARFQRTVNQAAAALDLEGLDLETEEGQQAAKDKLTKSYGVDVAIQAVSQLIQTMQARKTAEDATRSVSVW